MVRLFKFLVWGCCACCSGLGEALKEERRERKGQSWRKSQKHRKYGKESMGTGKGKMGSCREGREPALRTWLEEERPDPGKLLAHAEGSAHAGLHAAGNPGWWQGYQHQVSSCAPSQP